MRDTLDMACEAGFVNLDLCSGELERFEALVRADEREQGQKWFDAVTAQHKADIDRAFSAGLAEGEKLAIEAAAPVQELAAWAWRQAPIKTMWGDEMVVADLAIDKDHTVSVYCERDQAAKVEAMFTQPAAQRPAPEERKSVRSTWVGLTDEEIRQDASWFFPSEWWAVCRDFARTIENELKEKNSD